MVRSYRGLREGARAGAGHSRLATRHDVSTQRDTRVLFLLHVRLLFGLDDALADAPITDTTPLVPFWNVIVY